MPLSPANSSSRLTACNDNIETEGFVSLAHVLSENDPGNDANSQDIADNGSVSSSILGSSLPESFDPNVASTSPKAILSTQVSIFSSNPNQTLIQVDDRSLSDIASPQNQIDVAELHANENVESSKSEIFDQATSSSSLTVEPSSFVSSELTSDFNISSSFLASTAHLNNEIIIRQTSMEQEDGMPYQYREDSSTSFTSLVDLEPPERINNVGFSFQDYWSHFMQKRMSRNNDNSLDIQNTPSKKKWLQWPNFNFNKDDSIVNNSKVLDSPMDYALGKSILHSRERDIESNFLPRLVSVSDYEGSDIAPAPYAIPPELFHAGYEESMPRNRLSTPLCVSDYYLHDSYNGEPRPELINQNQNQNQIQNQTQNQISEFFCCNFRNIFLGGKWATVLSLFNTMVGSGLFLMPWIISESGIVIGTSLLFIIGCICCYGALLTSRIGEDYDDIAEVVTSIWGRRAGRITLFLSCSVLFSLAIVYSMVLIGSLSSVINGLLQLSGILNSTLDDSTLTFDYHSFSEDVSNIHFHSKSRILLSTHDLGFYRRWMQRHEEHNGSSSFVFIDQHHHRHHHHSHLHCQRLFLFNHSLFYLQSRESWNHLYHLDNRQFSYPSYPPHKQQQQQQEQQLQGKQLSHDLHHQQQYHHHHHYQRQKWKQEQHERQHKHQKGQHQHPCLNPPHNNNTNELHTNKVTQTLKPNIKNVKNKRSLSRIPTRLKNYESNPVEAASESFLPSFLSLDPRFTIQFLFLIFSSLVILIYLFSFAASNNPYSLAKFNVLGALGLFYLAFFMILFGFDINVSLGHPSFSINGNFYSAGAALVTVFFLQHATVSISKTPENRLSVEATITASYGLAMAFLLIPGIAGSFILLTSSDSSNDEDVTIPIPNNFLDALPDDSLTTIAARTAAMWQAFSTLPSLLYMVQLQLSGLLVDVCIPSATAVSFSVTFSAVAFAAIFQYFKVGIGRVLGIAGAVGGIYLAIFLPILLKHQILRETRRQTFFHKIIYSVILLIGVLLFVGEFFS